MSKWYKLSLGILAMGAVLVFGGIKPAQAEDHYCFCYTDLRAIESSDEEAVRDISNFFVDCIPSDDCSKIKDGLLKGNSKLLRLKCESKSTNQTTCDKLKQTWAKDKQEFDKKWGSYEEAHGFFGTVIPKCLLQDELTPDCKNVTVFVELFINLAKYLFGIVGALALAYFIYGGFVLILSQGNAEKVKSGTDAMLAAAIGLIIVFSAYLLIQFLGKSIGLGPGYNLL